MKGGSWERKLGTTIPRVCELRVDGWGMVGRRHPYWDNHTRSHMCLFWAKVGEEEETSGRLSLADFP